jgi:hypothetical protein
MCRCVPKYYYYFHNCNILPTKNNFKHIEICFFSSGWMLRLADFMRLRGPGPHVSWLKIEIFFTWWLAPPFPPVRPRPDPPASRARPPPAEQPHRPPRRGRPAGLPTCSARPLSSPIRCPCPGRRLQVELGGSPRLSGSRARRGQRSSSGGGAPWRPGTASKDVMGSQRRTEGQCGLRVCCSPSPTYTSGGGARRHYFLPTSSRRTSCLPTKSLASRVIASPICWLAAMGYWHGRTTGKEARRTTSPAGKKPC